MMAATSSLRWAIAKLLSFGDRGGGRIDNHSAALDARFKFIPQYGHQALGKFAPPFFCVAIAAFNLFLHVFKCSLTHAAGKPS